MVAIEQLLRIARGPPAMRDATYRELLRESGFPRAPGGFTERSHGRDAHEPGAPEVGRAPAFVPSWQSWQRCGIGR